MLRTLAGYLSEAVMGFLALAALSLGVAPLLFALPPPLGHAVALLEWAITFILMLCVLYAFLAKGWLR